MTHHEKPKPIDTDQRQPSPTEGEFTKKFATKIQHYAEYDAPKNPKEYDEEQATALLDLPDAIEDGDIGLTQSILEERFSKGSYKSIKIDRLKALAELRTAEKGEPTKEQLDESSTEVERAIMEFSHPDYTKQHREDLMRGRFGDIKDTEKVIDFIEDRIVDLGVLAGDPQKSREERDLLLERRDSLRIGRDRLTEQYIGLIEFEKEQARVKEADERKQEAIVQQNAAANEVRGELAALYGEDTTPQIDEPVRIISPEDMETMGLHSKASDTTPKAPEVSQSSDKEVLGRGLSPEEIAERDRETVEARERVAARRAERERATEKIDEPSPEPAETPVTPTVKQARQEVAEAFAEQQVQIPPEEVKEEASLGEMRDTKEALQKDAEKRHKRSALGYGLQAINNLPSDTRRILFGKHDVSKLLQPLGELQNKVDLDRFDTKVVDQLQKQLQSLGLDPRRRSAIWQEVGRPSNSDMGRTAQQIERALVPFLKHLQEVLKDEYRK